MTPLVSAVNRWLSKRAASDAGFTLVEVIISVSLLGLITGAATASMLTSTSAARSTSQSSHESTDAQLISGFLVRDAQAAGGSKPSTGTVDLALGVSKTNDAGCVSSDTLKLRFKWYDRFSPPTDPPTPVYFTNVVTYGLNGSHQLVRHSCVDGTPKGDLILGTNVQSVTAGCIPVLDCSVLPDIVTLSVTETNSPGYSATPFTFNLQAQVRSERQVAPSTASAGAVPLMALGGGPCPSTGAYLSISGNSDLKIELGGAVVNTADSTSPVCKAMKMSGNPVYEADSTSILSGGTCSSAGVTCPNATSFPTKLIDPLADLVAPVPSPSCSPVGPNPVRAASGHYVEGTYRQPVTLNSSDVFDDGVYIFCQGLKITGKLDAPRVLLFFAGGTLEMAGSSEVSIGTIPLPSLYSNVAIWVPKTNPATGLEIRGGTGVNSYKGIIYAPNATLTVSGGADISIGSVIARAIILIGTGHETFGPGITITTPFLPSAPQGLSYNFAMSVAGGIPPYSIWSANGLAATGGLSMTTGGVISGTPTILGTHVIEFFISDSSTPSRTTSRKLDLTVSNSALTISPLTLKSATLNNNYFQRITASGGSGVYTSWALKVGDSLPTGLSLGAPGTDYIDILGTPTDGAPPPFTLVVKDSLGFPAQQTFTLTVNPEPTITAASLALVKNTTETATYSAALATTGGTGPFTWAVSGGSLPSGVTLDPTTGLLSGAVGLSTANSYVFSVTATDVNLAVATALNIPLTVYAKPVITTSLLPNWDALTPYPSPTQMTNSGGSPPLTWSATGMPPGLTLSSSGAVLGTPTTPGTYSIVVTATDRSSVSSAPANFSVVIAAALAMTTPTSLPNGELLLGYGPITATSTGGTGTKTWTAINMPPGVTISSSGVISGTPTTASEYTPTITVQDATGAFVPRIMNKVTIFPALSVTFSNTFPDWDAGATSPNYPLPAAPSVTGGSGVYSFGVTPLPGLSLNASNGGVSGTPSTAATYNPITWTVSDSLGQSISRIYGPVTIYSPLTITGPNTMPNWDANFAYPNQTFIGGGGSPGAKVWSASGLPNGMSISAAGVVGGTPTGTGVFSATITYADPTVGASVSVVRRFTISTPPAITTPAGSLPPWTVGRPGYSATFAVAGGATPLTWSIAPVAVGGQPFAAATGLTFSSGTISGKPTGAVSNVAYRVTVTDAVGISNSRDYTLTLNPAITVSGLSGSVTRGVPYSSIVSATGGTGTLIWSSSSPLPAGLTWNVATRTVSGTPNSSGSWVMTVTATDSVGATGSQTQSVLIQPTVTSVAFVNGGNAAGAGKMEKGDSIVITFSDDILSSTLCSASWTGTSTNVLVKLNDGGTTANDTITLTADGGCVPSIGTFDLGGKAFATTGGPVVFGGANGSGGRSTIVLSTTTTPAPIKSTLTITLGTASPTNGNGMGSFSGPTVTANAIYNPNNPTTVISDPRGAFIAGTATITPTANKFF